MDPSPSGFPGNEKADEYAKAAADGAEPSDTVPDDYRWGTSLSHMTKVTTEAQARSTARWIAEHTGDPEGSTATHEGRASGVSSSAGRQSRWREDTTSCFPGTRP